MSNAIAIRSGFTMDYTGQIEYAQRVDGAWFKRFQERGRYGYRWGAWKHSSAPDMERTSACALKAYRLPGADSDVSRADTYAARAEGSFVAPCSQFGEAFWLCLDIRSVLVSVVRRTRAALLLAVDGREVWVPMSGLTLDTTRAITADGREVAFATVARWFKSAAAEKLAA